MHLSSNSKLQYRLISNNRLILLNRNSLINQILSNRQHPNDNFCQYLHRHCLQPRVEGYNYCISHILFDKNAPFRQCTYININTAKRCPNAARRLDRREAIFCQYHIKKKNIDNRKKDVQTTSDLPNISVGQESIKRKFEELEHYCPSEDHDHRRKNHNWDLPDDKCIVANRTLKKKMNESFSSHNHLQNEEDGNGLMLSDVLNLDLVDSDNESAEGYMDDPLRHAGVYTAEEVSHILRDKMLRLQTLYINLFNYYRHVLKNNMRSYYEAMKVEKSNHSIMDESDLNLNEHTDVKLLKAMKKYHKFSGAEKVINDCASKIRRSLIEESEEPTANNSECIFVTSNGPCNRKCVPLSSYCRNHILYDTQQVLYRPCAGGNPPCLKPTISYVHKNSCIQHVQLKFDSTEIDNILKCSKNEDTEPSASIPWMVNEPELFPIMDDMSLMI